MANKEVCPTCGSPNKNTVWALCYRQANPWHKVDSLPVEATRAQDRTPQDYAIEHGEYLATAAENYQKAYNAYCELMTTADRDRDEELIDDARQTQSDCWSGLNSAIYEFRKRAKRAVGVEAKPASKLTALDDGRYDEPASKEEEDGSVDSRIPRSDGSSDLSSNSIRDLAGEGTPQAAVKRFTIEVLQEKDGRWLADIPSVPRAMGYGGNVFEALNKALKIRAESRAEKK